MSASLWIAPVALCSGLLIFVARPIRHARTAIVSRIACCNSDAAVRLRCARIEASVLTLVDVANFRSGIISSPGHAVPASTEGAEVR